MTVGATIFSGRFKRGGRLPLSSKLRPVLSLSRPRVLLLWARVHGRVGAAEMLLPAHRVLTHSAVM